MIYHPSYRGISTTRNMKSRLAIKFPTPMTSDQMPAPGKTKLIKFPPSHAGKDVKCPGFPRGGMFKLQFDRYISGRGAVREAGGLLVSALVSTASGPVSSPGREHCIVFLGKTQTLTVPLSTQASFHPGVSMGTSKLLGNLTNCGEVTCD